MAVLHSGRFVMACVAVAHTHVIPREQQPDLMAPLDGSVPLPFEVIADDTFKTSTGCAGGRSEDAGFNGGFTVFQYGSLQNSGIDAVQFEFGVKHRRKGEIEEWAKRAARSLVAFHDTYLRSQADTAR